MVNEITFFKDMLDVVGVITLATIKAVMASFMPFLNCFGMGSIGVRLEEMLNTLVTHLINLVDGVAGMGDGLVTKCVSLSPLYGGFGGFEACPFGA